MRQIKIWLTAISALLCSLTASAHDFSVGGIYYNITSSTDLTVEVTSRSGYYAYSGAVVIPATVTYNGKVYTVTSIGNYAFSKCSSLTSITIPEGVTYIGSSTFYKCTSLTSITIPKSVTAIGDLAFEYCSSLTSITIPEGVTYIGSSAFEYCSSLTSITIPESVTSIGSYAFYGTAWYNNHPDGMMYLDGWAIDYKGTMPDNTSIAIVEGTKGLANKVFYEEKNIVSVTIPKSVISIGENAFYGCSNLYSVTIGSGVLSIGSDAFSIVPEKTIWLTNTPPTGYANAKGNINYVANNQYTSLNNVQIYPYLSSMFEVNGVKYVPVSPSERTCHAIDCAYDSTATTINVSETTSFKGVAMKVTEVMPYTFYGNNHIKEVSVSHLGHIGDYAFYNCDSIKIVNVSNQGNIGSQVFYDCDGIESVNVANLGEIGNQAFYDCDGIKDVNISNLGNIGSQVFYNSDAIESVTISNHGDIGEKAFYDCNGIKIIDVQNRGIVGAQAFYGCNAMETAIVANCIPTPSSIDDTPQTLADWTSTNHNHSSTSSKTYTFTAGEGATLSFNWSVSSEASYDKLIATLDGITILEKSGSLSGTYSNAISQGSHTLVVKYTKDNSDSSGSDQASVSNITVDKGGATTLVAGVGSEAFSGCSALKAVTLGDSIGSLGDKAFYQCSDLQEIVIPDSVKAVGEYCFSGCLAMKSAMIGVGVMTVPSYTFENCTALEDAVIGDGVTAINYYAFTGCTALTNVKLGNSVATINNYAFQNCSSLPEITLPQAVTKVGDYVFVGCSKLADVVIADRTTALALGSNGSSALFADCSLDSVYIGGKITYYTTSNKGYSPFYRNTSLRSVVITDREEQIYENEFYGCTNLQNVTIGNGVKSIGNYAFSGCSSLEGFSFGSNMESIGAEAFSDCTSLTSITSHAAVPPTCGTQALDDINKWSCTLRVPSGYDSAYQGADQWKEFFFVEDVVEVAKYTLTFMVDGEVYHTSSLVHKAEVTIPDAPTKEGYTFSGWSEVPETMPAEDVVISGSFAVNTYKVYYYVGDVLVHTAEVAYGESIPEYVYEPTAEGDKFMGWAGETYETMPAHDVTYTANITNDISQCTISDSQLTIYDLNGRKIETDDLRKLEKGIYIVNGKKVMIK